MKIGIRKFRHLALVIAFAALSSATDAQSGIRNATFDLPIQLPERAFLLIEAPRRFVPEERPQVDVQLRGGGSVQIAVFRVHDPLDLLLDGASTEGERFKNQGISIAPGTLGREAETLVAATNALPRAGRLLTQVDEQRVDVRVQRSPRRIAPADESQVYDSYESEETDVATWGVRVDRWATRRISLDRLPSGLYLVRAHVGPFAATCLLSVGDLVLLARRGDIHDSVFVTSADGVPVTNVRVEAFAGARAAEAVSTDSAGIARFAASDASPVRFIARRGDDVVWADVTHARLAECDPLVYLGVDRPVFRIGETIHVRGHVRACSRNGYGPLANEPVRVWPAKGTMRAATVRTDESGDFVAEVVATSSGIGAKVRGRDHQRAIELDHRRLPTRSLIVNVAKPWAAAGDDVMVIVGDDDGDWPGSAEVELDTPAGRLRSVIGPGRPARFSFRMPTTTDVLVRRTLTASLADGGTVTLAKAEIWTGRVGEVLHLTTDRTWAAENETVTVVVSASDLAGEPQSGEVVVKLRGSDGNQATGAPQWEGSTRIDSSGRSQVRIPLRGPGPWLVEAHKQRSSATMILWDRPRPPLLSTRGDIAVQPRTLVAMPGAPLDIDVRLPPDGGRAWLTLEQGSVWASRSIGESRDSGGARSASRLITTQIDVPPRARGLASIVVSHIEGGKVSSASSTVEVLTSTALNVDVETNRRVYAEGERANVTILARDDHGRPRDAVISLWLADAGYWDLGQDDYPMPTSYFALPGRTASAGDSTKPIAFGAEEGRHVDALLEWNGQRVPGSTFRHGWGYGGDLVRFDAQGDALDIANALARSAGLLRAEVCPEKAARAGRISLRARAIPWDLVAVAVGERLDMPVSVRRGVLRFACEAEAKELGGRGSGSGFGSGAGGLGAGRSNSIDRRERLEGTLHFVGLRRIGSSGKLDLSVPLPRHPGRWRIDVLAIADDGGGDRDGTTVSTTRTLETSVVAPERLAPGDEFTAELRVSALSIAGQTVALELALPRGIEAVGEVPRTVVLDRIGMASAPVTLRAVGVSACSSRTAESALRFSARASGATDSVRHDIEVCAAGSMRPLAMRASIGPNATKIHVPLPRLAAPGRLQIALEPDIAASIDEVLLTLDEPRWNVAALRLDRFAGLAALAHAVRTLPLGRHRAALEERVTRALRGEHAALEEYEAPDGGIAWWPTLPTSTRLTAEMLWITQRLPRPPSSPLGIDELASRARDNEIDASEAAIVAAALAMTGRSEHVAIARTLLDRAARDASGDLDNDTWMLRASSTLRDANRKRSAAIRLAQRIEGVIAARPSANCVGPTWFLCFARWDERGQVARAASELLDARHPGAHALAARVVDWLARFPAETTWWSWGTAEADVVALLARLADARPVRDAPEMIIDGRRVDPRATGAGRWELVVQRTANVELSFPALPGRATRLRIDGELAVHPPESVQGTVKLERRLVNEQGRWSLVVAVELERAQHDIEIGVPLPAGITLASDVRQQSPVTSTQAPWRSWNDVGRPADPPTRPRIEMHEGEVRFRFEALRSGRHELHLPLMAVAHGSFGFGPTWLRARDSRAWALVPGGRVHLE